VESLCTSPAPLLLSSFPFRRPSIPPHHFNASLSTLVLAPASLCFLLVLRLSFDYSTMDRYRFANLSPKATSANLAQFFPVRLRSSEQSPPRSRVPLRYLDKVSTPELMLPTLPLGLQEGRGLSRLLDLRQSHIFGFETSRAPCGTLPCVPDLTRSGKFADDLHTE
jgi:hypothetical protein